MNRFLAISAIVALGAGFLGGLEATSPDMKAAAEREGVGIVTTPLPQFAAAITLAELKPSVR